MRTQALHILRKDVQKLWPGIALAWVLLCVLTWKDAVRLDFTPSDVEGMLNLLLPAVWACLVGLLIQEEGFGNDRALWLTRPYRRSSLVLAKLLFVIVFIHVASLVSDVCILSVRGFLPWEHVPHLLRKQLLLAAVLTMPAAALAAATSSFPQFGFMAAVIVAVAVTVRTGVEARAPWISPETLRRMAAIAIVVAGSAAVLWLQYSRRKTVWSRGVGLGCTTAAAAVFVLIPKEAVVQAHCALAPDLNIGPRIAYAPETPVADAYGFTRSKFVPLIIPVRIDGLEQFAETRFEQWSVTVDSRPYTGALSWMREKPWAVQHVNIDRQDFAAIAVSPVDIRGNAAVTAWNAGPERGMAPTNGFADVPGLGHCYSTRLETGHGEDLLKVICEKPGDIPLLTSIRLVDPATGQEWKHRLGDSYTDVGYPSEAYLSPLTRRQTFFHIRRVASNHPGDRWTVPEDAVARSRFTLSAFQVAGCREIDYVLKSVNLPRHIAKVR